MKLAFFIGVYKDQALAAKCILALQYLYPEASIVSISDSVQDSKYAKFCNLYSVSYFVGIRLKLMEFGGQWSARFLKALLETDADVLIKIDPDTGIHAPLDSSRFPKADIFGNIRVVGGKHHIQGGFIAIWRQAAATILDSGLLGSMEYRGYSYSYPRFQAPYLQVGEQPSSEWLTCEDFILWDVAQRLGLKVGEFDQVCCHYRDCPSDAAAHYAVTHPYIENGNLTR